MLGRLFGSGSRREEEEAAAAAAAAEAAEARRREDELRERVAMFGDVWGLEGAADLLVFLEEGLISDINEAAVRAYGYRRDELFGRLILDLVAAEYRDECRAIMDRRDRTTHFYPTVHLRRNGQTFPAEIRFQSSIVAGNRIILALIHDLSERAEAENKLRDALRQANDAARSKSKFLTQMTHEILNPLHALLGMTELLLATPLDNDQREYASTVQNSGELLLESFGAILDFSKIQAGSVDVENIDFNLADCIEAAIIMRLPEAQHRKLDLLPFIDPQLPARLLGDPVLIGQIVTHLTVNALKYTTQGSVRVSVTLEKDDGRTVNIRFGVKDTGIGIAPEAQRRLFDEPETPATPEPSALSLAVCKRLVHLMGGSIGVTSEAGAGATFWFRLTLPVSAREHVPRRVLQDARILVVDAHEFARSITSRYLSGWGATIEEAASARDALHILHQRAEDGTPYPVVLLDDNLPDQDAFALASAIRGNKNLRATQLVMTAGEDAPDLGKRAIDAGFAAYMHKPLRQQRLFDCVASVVAAATSGAEPQAAPSPVRTVSSGVAEHASYRVLLVEDNPVNQRLARKQLETLGCQVSVAENGLVAVEMVRHEQFHLILMDLQMPEMDGFAATKQIRDDELRTGAHTVIVAMTAAARPEDRAACLAAEMDDYLSKPVRLDALRATLQRWVIGKRS
ncbi:MAG TPA: response regulator [Candidatus Acidoferrales bacterium]|nr:response regulator [Candidatus Acidoferrales bacterium]